MKIRGRTVFLDRDGTINRKAPEGKYVESVEELELLPGAAEAVSALNRAGAVVVVVTNQRGIALGRMTTSDLDAIHAELSARLATHGAHVDAYLHCPHGHDECDCRKPAPGLLLDAARLLPDVSLDGAVMIGDAESDVQAGRRAAVATVRLAGPATPTGADATARDLLAAVSALLAAGDG